MFNTVLGCPSGVFLFNLKVSTSWLAFINKRNYWSEENKY